MNWITKIWITSTLEFSPHCLIFQCFDRDVIGLLALQKLYDFYSDHQVSRKRTVILGKWTLNRNKLPLRAKSKFHKPMICTWWDNIKLIIMYLCVHPFLIWDFRWWWNINFDSQGLENIKIDLHCEILAFCLIVKGWMPFDFFNQMRSLATITFHNGRKSLANPFNFFIDFDKWQYFPFRSTFYFCLIANTY